MKARVLGLAALSLTISIPLATAYSGDLTFYTPAADPSYSACNIGAQPGESIVAISHLRWGPGNPNNNPMCGTTIGIYNPSNGKTIDNVKIVDKCMGCAIDDIDVNVELFEALGFDQGRGRVPGMDWGGSVVGGKKRDVGLEPLVILPSVKREPKHPHARTEGA